MPGPAPDPSQALAEADDADAEAEAEARAELEAAAASGQAGIVRLAAAKDVETLLALARAYRSGNATIARDFSKCFLAYRAAAGLGNAEAKYSVALFLLSGSIVPQDLKSGASELRAAADGGSTPAKIYLANLYEQGIHFKADSDKADVWYRSAARAANVKAEPTSREFTRALADLGSVRHGLELINDPATTEGDKGAIGRKMKAYGWQLRIRDEAASISTPPPASEVAAEVESAPSAAKPAASTPPPSAAKDNARSDKSSVAPKPAMPKPVAKTPAPAEVEEKKAEAPRPKKRGATSFTPKFGLVAFSVALLFIAIGWGAGVLLTGGAHELLARGQSLPELVGEHLPLILPAAVLALGMLPGILLYKAGTFARAFVVGGLAAIGGYAAFTVPGGAILAGIELQAIAFAAAAYLASALVLGVFGGSRFKPPAAAPKMGIGFPSHDDE